MKRFTLVLSLLLSVLLLLSSCNKDHDNDQPSGITGTWRATSDGVTAYLRLAASGDMTLYVYQDSTNADETLSQISIGTYSVQNNKIRFVSNRFTEEDTYTLGSDGVLSIIDGEDRWTFNRATSQETETFLSDIKDISRSAMLGAWRTISADKDTVFLYFSADGNFSNIDVVDGEVSVDDFRWTLNRNALLLTDIDEEGEESDFIDMFVDAVSQDHLTLKFLGHTMDLTKVDDSEVAPYLKQSLTPVSSKRKIWTQVISIPSVENLTSARLDWSVPR